MVMTFRSGLKLISTGVFCYAPHFSLVITGIFSILAWNPQRIQGG
jgi:hypothetical protein